MLSTHDIEQAGRVAVLMGGYSAEREISLQSGRAVLDALLRMKVNAHAVDSADKDFIQRLIDEDFARAFIALHGRGGEDGVIQGLLEMLHIPYTGSDVLASSLAMDKVRSKQLWLAAGLPTPDFICLHKSDSLNTEEFVQRLGLPLIVKPVQEGSSLGMSKVKQQDELEEACHQAFDYGDEILLEAWIEGAEYTLSIIGQQSLPMIRLQTPHEFYDFDAKYVADTTDYLCPCGLDKAQEENMSLLAQQAFQVLGVQGWGRVDFMLDEQGQAWLIEINTVPGLTDHSLVPMSAAQAGMDFDELVWNILLSSMHDEANEVN